MTSIAADREKREPRRREPRSWSVDRDVCWPQLDFQPLAPSMRSSMARLYGHVLQAEELGLRVAQRLLELAPEGRLRDFGRLQLADEARHVEFFTRVCARLGACEQVSPSLLAIEQEVAALSDYGGVMLHAQVVENAAITLLGSTARRSLLILGRGMRLPGREAVETLLGALMRLIRGDEATHVAFGMRALRSHCASMDAGQRHALEARVQTCCALMQTTIGEVEREYARLGFAPGEVTRLVAAAQGRYWRHLNVDPGL